MDQALIQQTHTNLIAPLEACFGEIPEGLADAICEECGHHAPDVMQEAARYLRRNNRFKPAVADVVKACVNAMPKPKYATAHEYPWQKAVRLADEMTKEYIRTKVKTSPTYQEALDGGWSGDLLEYAYEAANYQAQHICHCSNIGLHHDVIANTTSPDFENRLTQFRFKSKEAIAKGQIEITIPIWVIDRCKRRAATMQKLGPTIDLRSKPPSKQIDHKQAMEETVKHMKEQGSSEEEIQQFIDMESRK